jgi:oligopeptidase B
MTTRADELQWMRDPLERPRLIEHLRVEAQLAEQSLEVLAQLRSALSVEARSRLAPEVEGPTWEAGGSSWWFRRRRGDDFTVLCSRGPDGVVYERLDLNVLAGSSPYCRLAFWDASPDGSYLAYAFDTLGDESYQLRILDLRTGEESVARGRGVYYGGAWSQLSTTFYYVRHDDAFRPHEVRRHDVGIDFADDELVLEETDERFHVTTRRTESHLIISAASRLTTQEWLIDLRASNPAPVSVAERVQGLTYSATPAHLGGEDVLLLVTNLEALESRVMRSPGPGSAPDQWREVVSHDHRRRLYLATAVGDIVIIECRRSGFPRLLAFDWSDPTTVTEFSPSVADGTMRLAGFTPSSPSTITVEVESYLDPLRVESIDVSGGVREVFWESAVSNYVRARYVSERRELQARDGTPIPVTIVRSTSTPLDGTAPCLYYGYGAWETVIEPAFDPMLVSLLDRGVVYVHAHLRGGGELGRAAWLGGRMAQKMNTFTDFIDVGEQIGSTIVDAERIVTLGRSAGGLLMGAVYSLRPDLWRGVVAEAPFVDPITTMLDETAPLVSVEWDEWGDPRREEDLTWMLQWSPFDNVPPALERPALLVTSSQCDSRVSIWEPARWVQRLRDSGSSDESVVFRASIDPGAHAVPEGFSQGLDYLSARYAWILSILGV